MTITLGSRLVHRAQLHVPWIGRWVLKVWFDGAPPTGRVTVQWGSTALVGSVIPEKSGSVVGEGVATIVGGAGWHVAPPSTWLIDAMASPARVAQQLAQAVGETLSIGAGALRPGRVAFARAEQNASMSLVSLLADGALWWVGFDGGTQIALDRPTSSVSPSFVLEYRPDDRTAKLDIEEPSQAPLGGEIADASERFTGPQRIRSLDMEADENGAEAWVAFEEPSTPAPRVAALLETLVRPASHPPHATWRAATVQSQDAQRRASLRLEERDRELGDPLPVPSWCGVPGVSAEVFSGTRTLLAFDRAGATNPISALWSPYGQTGHVPKKVYHEANEEIRFFGAPSAGVARVGAAPTFTLARYAEVATFLAAVKAFATAAKASTDPTLAAAALAMEGALSSVSIQATTKLEAA